MADNRLEHARKRARYATRLTAAAYAAVGVVWVIVTDAAVGPLQPRWAETAQRYKGLAFVALTTLGIYLLMRWGYRLVFTSLERAEAAGRSLRGVFERHPLPMWVYDRRTLAILHVNSAASRLYGRDLAWFLARTVKDLVVPDDAARLAQTAQADPGPGRVAGVFRHQVGERVVHLRQQEMALAYDGHDAVIVTAEDVTDETLARHAVELREIQLHQLHASLGEGLWLSSADGDQVIYVSSSFETIYGRAAREFKDNVHLWLEVVHPNDRRTAKGGAMRMRKLGMAETDYRIGRADGATRWVSDRRCVIHAEDGSTSMLGGVVEDITARKEHAVAQEWLNARLEDEVSQRTRDLEQANVELRAFSRTAAHDLKTPLHGIAGMAYLLASTHGAALSAEGRQLAQGIERSAREMGELVDDLLRLSSAAEVGLRCTEQDMVPMIRDVLADLQMLEPARQVHSCLPPSLTAVCDAGLMRSLWLNVLGNAWKFSRDREVARIVIAAHETRNGVEISVSDNGVGFGPEQADKLFKPFQRLHSRRDFNGTGLGLVTCRRIVQRHGGDIWLTSEPDVGTTVRFTLPRRGARECETDTAVAANA